MPAQNNFDGDNTRYLEEIATLKLHSKQNHLRSMQEYARADKVATRAAVIVFIVMSYFLHTTLLGSGADLTTHILAFILNSLVALVTSMMIGELHPSRMNAAFYHQSSIEIDRKIKLLELEMNRLDATNGYDNNRQKRESSVAPALSHADSMSQL